MYFIMGISNVSDEIEKEYEKFKDIVIGNFADNYENLPLKTLVAHSFYNSDFFLNCENHWIGDLKQIVIQFSGKKYLKNLLKNS